MEATNDTESLTKRCNFVLLDLAQQALCKSIRRMLSALAATQQGPSDTNYLLHEAQLCIWALCGRRGTKHECLALLQLFTIMSEKGILH